MSKINAVRIINLNYNNNAIRISDETFHMNGKSTLLSMRNGGGKSVLVQMMMAPFVHKRFRDAKDRPFESYFTTAKPTFLLVEWALDHGGGYAMAGMMVRRRQEMSADAEDKSDDLEIIQFISEYEAECPYDIRHLPVVEKRKKEMVLKSFVSCRQLFDSYKKDPSVKFFSYDMNNSAQARQYFDKLAEYRIYYKEWEHIISKVNEKESGLSDLFLNSKDEKGLVENWLLDVVANKLNKGKNRMKEFQTIAEKYVCQYKDNKSKIKRRDVIRQFSEEAQGVKETAKSYQAVEEELALRTEQIGIFLWQLGAAKAAADANCARLLERQRQTAEQTAHLKYQQISKAVYEAMDEERHCRAEREMIQLEREEKEQEYMQAKHMLHLFELARQQLELDGQAAECAQYEQQIAVLRQKEQDFSAERGRLGYTLRLHYETAKTQKEEQANQARENLESLQAGAAAEDEKADAMRASVLELSQSLGSVQAKIQEYDAKEEAYNQRYEPGLIRNILGEYEPAALDIRRQEYEKELDGLKKDYRQMVREAEAGSWTQKEYERNIEDARQKKMQKEQEFAHAKEVCEQYERQLEERRRLIRYFALDAQADLYSMEKILYAAQRRLSEAEWAKRSLEKEEDLLQKEYKRLTQGRVLELPEPFEKLLEQLGIAYVYGMEWLKKNSYTEEENKGFVRAYPFLPYALLLSARDMEKLKQIQADGNLPYTSFPIPLMAREQLQRQEGKILQPVLERDGVSFYLLFNEHLLNEEKLRQIVSDIEQRIEKKKAMIQLRREEYESYFEKKEQLRSQTVTKELQDEAQRAKERAAQELEALTKDILKQKEEAQRLVDQMQDLQQQMRDCVKTQSEKERRLEDLNILAQAYESYQNDRQRQETLQHDLAVAKEREQLSLSLAKKLRERARKQEIEMDTLLRLAEALAQKASCYAQYEKAQKEQGSIEELENRYQAITSQISLRQQELERLLQSAREKEQRLQKEMARRQKKYKLADAEWADLAYDAKAEEYQEQLLAAREQQYERKKAQWNEADKNAALASQRLEQQKNRMLEKCHQSKPLPKEEIQPVDFETEIEKKEYARKELEQAAQSEQKRVGWYEEHLTALAEYTGFLPGDEQKLWEFISRGLACDAVMTNEERRMWETISGGVAEQQEEQAENNNQMLEERLFAVSTEKCRIQMIAALQAALERLSGEELRRKKGMLIRDYNQCMENRRKQKEHLTRLLNEMVRKEAFAEDFYRKPIEAMLSLTDQAGQVLRQLFTTLQSYHNLMEKLAVDISVVEEEKLRIVELLGAYVQEIHQNLGRIDRNSSIQIRDKTIKMLKITLPDWEENENLYQARLRDFMDEITGKCIELLEQNCNIQEYLGKCLTAKNLYDVVAGIENVQIRLYKIEAQREYPITWSQVARNSGGEGFLSAFIILSSLLYYMRRDDSDLFADHNEGKVLVMDNPFAQTNAAHLLKPLMDMAKKTNTQLICLSGLGGDSIYNRFDNIYVLNLIAASMQKGTQYLKAEHLRGEEPETVLVSQIEVTGQQELIF